ncbi:hypothetical protein DM860_004523 [Cuscuta australis]|uniref:Uncharacterized protein n=1 Tax=Cuscuta australis TaxID=267555 RepID=A0A328E806_9ASTE|nr:hypothetical protein DM860_004523 [Cuscuta australis]
MYGQERVFARGLINVVEGDMVISKTTVSMWAPMVFIRLDHSVVVASKRAWLTISVSLNLCRGDGDRKWCVVQKDLVFDAVFKMEAQSIHDVFGGKVTVSIPRLQGHARPSLRCSFAFQLCKCLILPIVLNIYEAEVTVDGLHGDDRLNIGEMVMVVGGDDCVTDGDEGAVGGRGGGGDDGAVGGRGGGGDDRAVGGRGYKLYNAHNRCEDYRRHSGYLSVLLFSWCIRFLSLRN